MSYRRHHRLHRRDLIRAVLVVLLAVAVLLAGGLLIGRWESRKYATGSRPTCRWFWW